MTDKDFVDDMRTYSIDHLPDGWPAVQTQQIDRLIAIIDQLTVERDEAGSQDAIGKTPAQVAAAILREFGLSA